MTSQRLLLCFLILIASRVSGMSSPKATTRHRVHKHIIRRHLASSITPGGGDNNNLSLIQRYSGCIDRRPLVTKSVTAAVVGSLGDVLAQYLEGGTTNWTRLAAAFVSCLFYVGPFLHYWFNTLWAMGRWLENKKVTRNTKLLTLIQVLVDQTIGVAMFFPTYFYAYELSEAFVSLRIPNWSSATNQLLQELQNVFWMQYKVWPLANYLNFLFVPENLRPVASNILALGWQAYMSTRFAAV